jgi:hypothetical protein
MFEADLLTEKVLVGPWYPAGVIPSPSGEAAREVSLVLNASPSLDTDRVSPGH